MKVNYNGHGRPWEESFYAAATRQAAPAFLPTLEGSMRKRAQAYEAGKRDGYRVAALHRVLLEGPPSEEPWALECYSQGYNDGQDEYLRKGEQA